MWVLVLVSCVWGVKGVYLCKHNVISAPTSIHKKVFLKCFHRLIIKIFFLMSNDYNYPFLRKRGSLQIFTEKNPQNV